LVYTIGECYYNTNKLVEAEKCFKRVQVLDPEFRNIAAMQHKIRLKRKGIR